MDVHAQAIAGLTEKEWQAQVKELASLMGFKRAYHTFDSRRSASGFPDLVLVRERVIFLELKREKGKLSETQKEWLNALIHAGAEAYVARPSDFDSLAEVLRRRQPSPCLTSLGERTLAELGIHPHHPQNPQALALKQQSQ